MVAIITCTNDGENGGGMEEAGTDGGEDGFESSCSQQLLPTTHLYSCCPIVAHMAPLLASVGDRSSAQHYQTNTKYKTQTQTQTLAQTLTQAHMATLAALATGQVISFQHCLLL